ncbi:hypothetical protein [Corynebacterium sp. p3-SID1194]|uniref:hypothetical protein n=1 Tax=Corynebacterium sp. p3-SID1194 TaxID=2916105 RepID=UPI0021A8503C|nr:hypothetical protein [Corynebacterium sp. p3-SID1194]MCT1450726.1 hypothetical protein [Corynebacterium sp. p3-SID1194]
MKRALAIAACLLLAGCSAEPDHVLGGRTWEVTAVYTDPDVPGAVPADAAGRALVVFGAESLTARTACAPLQAGAEIRDDTLRLKGVRVGDVREDCMGGSRRVHDQLTGLLTEGAEFDVTHLADDVITLKLRSDALDRPTIKLVAQ